MRIGTFTLLADVAVNGTAGLGMVPCAYPTDGLSCVVRTPFPGGPGSTGTVGGVVDGGPGPGMPPGNIGLQFRNAGTVVIPAGSTVVVTVVPA